MEECFLERSSRTGRRIEVMRKWMPRASAAITLLTLLIIGLILASCGGGGNQGVSSEVVSGVAATGAPLAGEATIKDSSTPALEKKTVIGSDGSFAFDVSDMRGPFILRATGSAGGERHILQSFADGPGTANINPLANAVVANAAEVEDPAEVYENPDKEKLQTLSNNLSEAVARLLMKLRPLLMRYNADSDDPIRVRFKADHTRLDGLFDDVKITLYRGILTIINKKTGAVIFTGKISDILNGHFTEVDDDLPQPGSAPAAPTGVTAVGGAGQVTVSWTAVGNAISYNIYWSTTSGVTTSSGTKITGATHPYVHTVLLAGTTYYYIVTAVNSAGESVASAEASAKTDATPAPTSTPPAVPTGIIAAGGTNQVTISWSAVSGADSYNIYWSTTPGSGTNGTKILGATSPTVQTGLTAGATYYYVVTAVNNAGESAPSVQAAATTLTPTPPPTAPAAPTAVTATGGTNQVSLSWSAVSGASSYNVYWSTTSGLTPTSGTEIAGVTSPYVHTGLSAGTTYYYIVTAVNGVGESNPSAQASATTNAPAPTVPAAPTGVTATGGSKQVAISWAAVTGLTYNLYWSTTSGVTTATGTKITGATSPYVQTGLADGTAYYYIVTAVNGVGEGPASTVVTATTNPPVPTVPGAPTGVTAAGGTQQVTISWTAVSGLTYNLYWSTTSGVTTTSGTKISGVTTPYIHTGLADGTAYYYVVTALNIAGESAASSEVTATTNPPASLPVSYSATIQPILNASCTGCHNATYAAKGVNLSTYADTVKNVTPGNATGSLLYNSLIGNGVTKMPPGGSLSSAQIQSIVDWINQGALNN